jgi:hypothetical protein
MGVKYSTTNCNISDIHCETSRNMWHKHVNEIAGRQMEINKILCLPQTNLDHDQRREIELFFKTFLRCMFYEQVTENLLYKRICNHADDLTFVNPNIAIDKKKYISETYDGLRCKLIIYSACLILYDA